MILSDREIKKYIKEGKIKIKPKPNFKEQLGPCSLDLHLGNIFKVFKHTKFPYIDLRKKDLPIEEIMEEIKIKPSEPLIMQPGDFILATTKEEIMLPPDLMARLDGRSSLGRLGIIIHITAARIDPGWKGRPTMELGNLGIMPIALYPGMRVCAVTFETLSTPCEKPYLKQKDHKYAGRKKPLASKINEE